MKFNLTQPLPTNEIVDNQIYTYPTLSHILDTPVIKRSKSCNKISTNSLSAFFRTRSTRRKGRHPLSRPNSPTPTPIPSRLPSVSSSLKFPQEEEFSFYSTCSELESLPSLTDDEDGDEDEDYSPLTTPEQQRVFHHPCPAPVSKVNLLNKLQAEQTKISIFEIPEIVNKILNYVDLQYTDLPQEVPPVRRRPLSYNHAMLIHGTKEMAEKSLLQPQNQVIAHKNPLFNCLLVNKLFHKISKEIISHKCYFDSEDKFKRYLQVINSPNTIKFRPKVFILHKLFQTRQSYLDAFVKHTNFEKLEWLEIYMCPKLFPCSKIISQSGPNLKKLVITGSKSIDDDALIQIAKKCPNLSTLDLRACEQISNFGIYQLSKHCHNLRLMNFGRKNRGYFITDSSIVSLIRSNPNLHTIGLAGTDISDRLIWEIANSCRWLERLSLNNCPRLTDMGMPVIISNPKYFPRLSVLELRFSNITNWKPIIEFKRRQEAKGLIMIIELCEKLMLRIRQQELEMDKMISQRIFKDILEWVNNDEDDGDISFHELMKQRATNAMM